MNKKLIVLICRIILMIILFTTIGFFIYAEAKISADNKPEATTAVTTEATTEITTAATTEATTEQPTTEATTQATTEEVTTEATTEAVSEATTEAAPAVDHAKPAQSIQPAEPATEAETVIATVTDAETEAETATEAEAETALTYAGYYTLTAYEWTGNPCADGQYPQTGLTAASNDPALWHRWIYIEGYGNYYVHDRGGMARSVIDLYMGDADACIQFGRRGADVYLID